MAKLKSSASLSPPNSMVMPQPTKTSSPSNHINADAPDDDSSSRRQLALIPPPTTTTTTAATITSRYSGFRLPRGWRVRNVPRSDPSRIDKYYYEPGTGLKFRSLRAVERYINGEEFTPSPRTRALTWHNKYRKGPRHKKMIICGGKMTRYNEETFSGNHLAIVASGKTTASSPYNLPDGWVVEEVPRRDATHTDKYYYEPGNGRKFRSYIAAQRYIAELKEDIPLSAALAEIKEMNRPLSKAFKLGRLVKNSVSCKRQYMGNNTQTSSFVSPPMKVNWVLASHRGDVWNPFIFGSKIPDSVNQQWNERFMLAMNVNNCNTPNCSTRRHYDARILSSLRACDRIVRIKHDSKIIIRPAVSHRIKEMTKMYFALLMRHELEAIPEECINGGNYFMVLVAALECSSCIMN